MAETGVEVLVVNWQGDERGEDDDDDDDGDEDDGSVVMFIVWEEV